MAACCIGLTRKGPNNNNETCRQHSFNLVHHTLSNQDLPSVLTTSSSVLEGVIGARLATSRDASTSDESVDFFISEDAHLLHCRPIASNTCNENDDVHNETDAPTFFGIRESTVSLAGAVLQNGNISGDIPVEMSLLEPHFGLDSLEQEADFRGVCCCSHPRGNWRRKHAKKDAEVPCTNDVSKDTTRAGDTISVEASYHASVKLIDLTKLQNSRRGRNAATDSYPCFDTPGKVFHLLRSVLHCSRCSNSDDGRTKDKNVAKNHSGLHCASPWKTDYNDDGGVASIPNSNAFVLNDDERPNSSGTCASDPVVAFLMKGLNPLNNLCENSSDSSADNQFWENLEEKEIEEMIKFRTGDAAPSYFLYSSLELAGNGHKIKVHGDANEDQTESNSRTDEPTMLSGLLEALLAGQVECTKDPTKENYSSSTVFLLVYRHLPPREVLTSHHPKREAYNDLGSQTPPCYDANVFVGCLWDTYLENAPETDSDIAIGQPIEPEQIVKYRMVSPPYQSWKEEYPGLLDSLLKGIDVIRDEATRIPQWTAWPEKNHYASENDKDGDDGNSVYPASWTVFPLCHTFPANDVNQRIFIQKTCGFVPQTTKLLQDLGPVLRTALFSRLDRRTTLGTHTGWEDLANHVLRLHIPVIVPGEKSGITAKEFTTVNDNHNPGLCGTWVDGCVETHCDDHVICFDDSKVHRAFNYSDDERVVLIIDLERQCAGPMPLPVGTASGGHTDELDAFIKELT